MRKEEVNNEWFYGTVRTVHFLPAAARTVNSRNLSMSATRLDAFPPQLPDKGGPEKVNRSDRHKLTRTHLDSSSNNVKG